MPNVCRGWQRHWSNLMVKTGLAFALSLGADACVISGNDCGFSLVYMKSGKRVNCHYKDYLNRPHGWIVSRRKNGKISKLSKDSFMEMIDKLNK